MYKLTPEGSSIQGMIFISLLFKQLRTSKRVLFILCEIENSKLILCFEMDCN